MVATFSLLACALVTSQAADSSGWLLTPRLGRGQELVYTGSFTEEFLGTGVQCKRSFRLETSVFVLDSFSRGMNVALLTVLELRAFRAERGQEPPPRSVRLELARVDGRGQIAGDGGTSLLVPIEGPASIECGAFVEVPATRVSRGQSWPVAEKGRPARTWKLVGLEAVGGVSCLKLAGEQKSEDWDHPRADRTAWMRKDTVWLAPALGVAYRVERKILRREPARREPTQQSVVRYDLLSRLTYPGALYEQRRREIAQARRFAEEAAPLLRQPAQHEEQLGTLLERVTHYMRSQPPIEPYCKAIAHLKSRIEAARRGELAAESVPEEKTAEQSVATVGRLAPDFMATDLIRQESVRLHRLLGRPLLIVFFKPESETAGQVLRFAAEQQRRGVTVLGMAVSDEAEAVRRQHAELKLAFPVLSGKGFGITYGATVTPRLIVLDARGIVRGTYTGWGSETPQEVREEIERCLTGK
jgi:peroxiredoxin